MLPFFLVSMLANYPSDMVFQQVRARPYYTNIMGHCLDHKLPKLCTGSGGPFSWPSRSPDLAQCNFFPLWYIKDQLYRELSDNIAYLMDRVGRAIASITEESPQKVINRHCEQTFDCN